MKVKKLIEVLNDMDKDSNIWLDVPYIKGTTSPYDIMVNDFNVEKTWDNIDKEYYVTLSSNNQLYDHFENIKVPARILKH
jgi:hypothetical protein|tara:strand:- start:415 stop:654 length:240 start_codon:yes stop_codon:yes gene_type:complete